MTALQKRKLIVPGFVLALVLLALMGVGAYRQGMRNAESAQWVRHTFEVLNELAGTLSLVQDVWGGARGYVITGEESYLEPFNLAAELIPQKIERLRTFTADNAEQQRRLHALERLIARRIAISQSLITLRKTLGKEAAERVVGEGEGKRVMDEIREVVAEMEAAEDQLLQQRIEELRASNTQTLALFMVFVVLLGGLLLASLVLVRRNAAAQQREIELTEKARAYAQNIVDTVREPLLVLGANQRVLSASRSFYLAFGVNPQETEGKLLYELGDGQWNIPELRKLLQEILPQHTSFQDFEVEGDFPVIGRRCMLLNARKIFRVGNNTQSILLAIEDITERKRAEEALREANAWQQAIVDHAGYALISTTPEGVIRTFNTAAERMLGYTAEEMVGRSPQTFHDPQEVAERARIFSADLQANIEPGFEVFVAKSRRGLPNEHEWTYVCKDGTRLTVLLSVTALRDADARITGFLGIATDITARKEAEAILKKSHRELQNRFEVAVRASGQLLYEWDAKTNTVSYGNTEALGYSHNQMGNGLAHWVELIHPDDREAFNQELERSLQTKVPFHLEYRVRRKDGEYIYVEDRGYHALGEDGSIRGTIGFVADISERKKLEEQFRQAQKMEAVGRLAGGVAHDFNNLLGVIIGFGELLGDRIRGDEEALKYLTEIRKAGDRAATLTRQLLAFSRKQVLEPRVLDLNGIISDQGKMLHRLIGEDIKLVTVAAPDLGQVKADPGQIEQVILNLVINARDAMPKGGKLTIETANVELDEHYARMHMAVVPGRYVMIAVSDTGLGMDADTRVRIFEPFFTTKREGTGLGLATVYGIVKQSGGNIWVYSEPGKGTTFKVYLPRVDAAAEVAGVHISREAAPGGSETVLLVEDSESLRAVAREFLVQAGYTVLEALDGSEAVRIAGQRKAPIHLLLTDVVMPGMSGPDVAEQVRRHHPETTVLYMSGYTDDAIVHHGVLEEGIALLSKPFAREDMVRKVRQVLDSSK